MTALQVIEGLGGVLGVYIGMHIIIRRELPIVSEGDDKPLGWLRGRAAVLAGIAVLCFSGHLLAAAFGFVRLL